MEPVKFGKVEKTNEDSIPAGGFRLADFS